MDPTEFWENHSNDSINKSLKIYSGIINTREKFLNFVKNLNMNILFADDFIDGGQIKEFNGIFGTTILGIQSMLECNFKLGQDDTTYSSELNNNEYYYRFTNSNDYKITIIIKYTDGMKKYGIKILSGYGFYIKINGKVINSLYFSQFDDKLSKELKLDNQRITDQINEKYYPNN